MLKLISPFELSKFIENNGYDVFPEKQPNGMYKCFVWKFEKCLGIGKFEYKTWEDSVIKTSMIIYKKL